jgi:hypothetical protein
MERYWLIIRNGYVINRIVWGGENWTYPHPHDTIIEDVDMNVDIGDWYEEVEGIFYKPLSTPPDWPEEILIQETP